MLKNESPDAIQKCFYKTPACANLLEVFRSHKSTIPGVLKCDFRGENVAEMHIFRQKKLRSLFGIGFRPEDFISAHFK